MNTHSASTPTRIKVGVFAVIMLLMIGLLTVLVNDKPYWWRNCQLVHINIEDATGLRMKSAVRSMGIEIGYLKSVELSETHVDLGICITAPVEVLPATRAYIKGEGFLGDKFVELKPVKYVGPPTTASQWVVPPGVTPADEPTLPGFDDQLRAPAQAAPLRVRTEPSAWLWSLLENSAFAEDRPKNERQIPVGQSSQDMQSVINRVDSLVNEMTSLTSNLRQAINPEQLKDTMKQLNKTLENASRTLSPEGGLNQTAQRTLAKLEDAIEQLRDMLTRINQGQGSVGKLLNDPVYAEEVKKALLNLNKLLNKAADMKFVVDVGGEEMNGYDGGRAFFKLQIWPQPWRYYLLGISVDPRGRRTVTNTDTTSGGVVTHVQTNSVEQTGIVLTGMLGAVFFEHRLDLSIGALYGDGAVSAMGNLGPVGNEEMLQLRVDGYARGNGIPFDMRFTGIVKVYKGVYVRGGVESIRKVNDSIPWNYGAGITFDDDDIKLLFALK